MSAPKPLSPEQVSQLRKLLKRQRRLPKAPRLDRPVYPKPWDDR